MLPTAWVSKNAPFTLSCEEELRKEACASAAASRTSATTRCRCGADHGLVVRDIREQEGRLRENVTHPWHHDTRERAEQHLRDEAAYPKDSPWRYNDITARNNE